MRPDVEYDFQWGRQFLPHLRSIVADHLIAEASPEEDMRRNTDLIVLKLDGVRIACRVRRHNYLADYAEQFTIRVRRPTGESELGKVLEGWGDYFIYGFAAGDTGPRLARWLLADLSVFRLWFTRRLYELPPGEMPGVGKSNGDGSSTFRAFYIADLPRDFVIAQGGSATFDRQAA